jgi:membrane fusion protein, copper/silver efflux system
MNVRKRIVAVSVFLVLAAAGIIGWYAYLRQPGKVTNIQGAVPAASQQASVQQEEALTVEIPEDKQLLIGVKVVQASMVPMKKNIHLSGIIETDEQKLFTINTKIEGWIEKLYVDYLGQNIKKGQPLLEIYSPEMLSAQQELIDLMTWKISGDKGTTDSMLVADSKRLYDAARKRLRLWDITETQIARIEKTGKPMRNLTILSPVSGYVAKRYATRGMKVMAGEPLLDIADLSQVWVVAEVYEPDISLIKPGMTANITFAGMPGKVYSSPVDFIYPTISPDTRTLKVRCILPNPSDSLKPQMFATVEIAIPLGTRLAVPDDAVMDTGERQIVYVDKGEGLFEPRQVIAGLRSDNMREIVSGLKRSERVAASALFLIDSEAQLRGVSPASH